jgi:histidyl-tRNA synthetase
MGTEAHVAAIRAARNMRNAGVVVELAPVEQKFGKALDQADRRGAQYVLMLGEDEVTSGEWTLKTLADGTQRKVSEQQLIAELKKM